MATKDEAAEVTEIATEATMSVGAILFNVGLAGCLVHDVRVLLSKEGSVGNGFYRKWEM